MVFPQTPLELHVEIDPTGTEWIDITSDLRGASGVSVNAGKPGEGQAAPASFANFTLDNSNYQYSPNNPSGLYYPDFNRNTPVRIYVEKSEPELALPLSAMDGYALAADSASLDITGDIDVRVDVTCVDIIRTIILASKWSTTAAQKSWKFLKVSTGLSFGWFDGAGVEHTETVPIRTSRWWDDHRKSFRVTLDVNNGAGGYTITFYYADSMDGPWTAFGDPIVGTSTTSIRSTSADLILGTDLDSPAYVNFFSIHSAVVMSGIAGSEVANPDFSLQTVGATSFSDDAGNTWTITGDAEITKRSDRFYGEIGAIYPGADITGTDKYVNINANGPSKRVQQGTNTLQSSLRRAIPAIASLEAYWPCEDGENSSTIASALSGAPSMVIAGIPSYASYSNFKASSPIVTVDAARLTGNVPSYTSSGEIQVRFIINFPASGLTNNDVLFSVYTLGTLARFDLIWTTAGGLSIAAYDSTGASLGTGGPGGFAAVDIDYRLSIELAQNGSDVDWGVYVIAPGASVGGITGTISTCTIGRCKRVVVNPNQNADGISVGHITVQSAIDALADLADELNAWLGESSTVRFARLCDEEGVAYRTVENGSVTPRTIGYQSSDSLINLIRECEYAEGAIFTDDRHQLATLFISRGAMHALAAHVTLDLSSKVLSSQPLPVYDDQLIRNDIEISRIGGSSYRATDITSRISSLTPPNGIGPYKDTLSVNVSPDDILAHIAGWSLHLGTYDGARFANITVNRARSEITSAIGDSILDLEIGDRIDLTNPASWISNETIQLQIVGISEYLSNFEHSITFNCQPAEPWRAGVYEHDDSRYDTDGSEFATPVEGYKATFAGAGTRSYDTTDITGDIDIRVKASLNDWTPSARSTLAAKYQPTGNQRSWRFQVISATEGTAGCLRLYWSNNGSASLLATSTAATGISDGATKWCRVTLDVNNGAAGNDVKFYLSDDGVTWTQLGSTVTQGFTTSIFDSSALYQLGAGDGAALGQPLSGVIYGCQVISGLTGGTSLVPFDPSEWTDGYSGSATGGATLSAVTSNAFIAISNTGATYWTTDAGQYPILIRVGGEIISVAGCTGTGASQVFTNCTRSVNDAVKIHSSGEDFSLAAPVYYG